MIARRQWVAVLLLVIQPPVFSGNSSVETDATLERGRILYNQHCYFCHGYSGDAKTLASAYLEPPPRDFTVADRGDLTREKIISAITKGRPGTAMQAYSGRLSALQIANLADFIGDEFITNRRINTRYHTPGNGWPDHSRFRPAFPFVFGQLSLATPSVNSEIKRGRRLFIGACISCHDPVNGGGSEPVWRKQSVSYPRNNYPPGALDAISSASVYARHDLLPQLPTLSADARAGQRLWQANCAFCHAADGSGQNWIGSFLDSRPRDLTDTDFMRRMSPERLRARIQEGVPGTSMPAWKHVLDDAEIDRIIDYIEIAFHRLDAR